MSRNNVRRLLGELPPGLLAFNYAEIANEMRTFAKISDKFLRPESVCHLNDLAAQFGTLSSINSEFEWKTRECEPIRTLPSHGYERGNKTSIAVYGSMEFKWNCKPLGNPNPLPGKSWFVLANSCVRINLCIEGSDLELGHWDFDVGNDESPGCHFHAKPHWRHFYDEAGFSNPFPVPRLPSLLFMPTDCLEFVFGELWQESWHAYVAQSTSSLDEWKRQSRERHLRMAQSLCKRHSDNTQLTGWMALKTWKPNATEFTST